MTRTVSVVPHTHWDREWYAPFQTFRMKLVDLLDDLLPRLEADPGFAHFLLDGQVAVVDDYLAVRPEAAGRLRRLAASGRLAVGPWYVLMDEFLVSGETIVRDLELGIERAAAFGGAMDVGYLPDMFGHVAQMPQVLRQFHLDHAVVWRGVPAAVDRSAFWWEAPDGSTVRAEYLPEGYGNGATLPADGEELVAMVRRFVDLHGDLLTGPILWMNGTDHLTPKPWLARVVAEANAAQDDYRFVVRGLAEHLAEATAEDLPRWRGELRSGARANLLMGVASNRVDVKQAAAAAERGLERLAEPLSALFLPATRWPAALLGEAWRQVILDAAHDSSCACSVDEVVDAVLVRYREASAVAEGLTARALDALAAGLAREGALVVNPSATTRSGVVELRLPGTGGYPATQQLSVDEGLAVVDGVTRADLAMLVQAALDNLPHLQRGEVEVEADGTVSARLVHDPAARAERYTGPVRAEVARLAAERPEGPARLALSSPPSQQVLVHLADVPGFGWRRWEPEPLPDGVVTADGWADDGAPDGTPALANDRVRLVVDPASGTFALEEVGGEGRRVEGLDRLVDDGDAGDTYNWSPPRDDTVVTGPEEVAVRLVEAGPLRGRVEVRRRHRWPERVAGDSRVGAVDTEVTTVLELLAGSGLVQVTTTFENRSRDHRLRTWLPLPRPASHSHAECAFAVVERGLVAEGGPTERPLPTFPSRRFVAAGGLVVVHDGLLEYELVGPAPGEPVGPEGASALALTLVRATGLLSNGPMAMRPLPAGPVVATPGAQVQGARVARYGVAFDPRGPDDGWAPVADLADELSLPLLVTRAPGGGHLPDEGRALEVQGATVSAVVRRGGALVVRVVNLSSTTTVVRVPGRHGWLCDLRGEALAPFDEQAPLGPWRIATLHLADPPPEAGPTAA